MYDVEFRYFFVIFYDMMFIKDKRVLVIMECMVWIVNGYY